MDNDLPEFSLHDVERWFTSAVIEKAKSYAHRISNVKIAHNYLSGKVGGSAPHPYRTEIFFLPLADVVVNAKTQCTCPVVFHCEHAAALLMDQLNKGALPLAEDEPRFEIAHWLRQFSTNIETLDQIARQDTTNAQQNLMLAYVLITGKGQTHLQLYKVRARKNEGLTLQEPYEATEKTLLKPPKFIQDDDIGILRLLFMYQRAEHFSRQYLEGKNGAHLIEELLPTGRLFFLDAPNNEVFGPLVKAESRDASFAWTTNSNYELEPTLQVSPAGTALLGIEPAWYVDVEHCVAGPLSLPLKAEVLTHLFRMPAVQPDETAYIERALQKVVPSLTFPTRLSGENDLRLIRSRPTAILKLASLYPRYNYGYGRREQNPLHIAQLSFEYENLHIAPTETKQIFALPDGKAVRLQRDRNCESQFEKQLQKLGFNSADTNHYYSGDTLNGKVFGLRNDDAWRKFVNHEIDTLNHTGWRIEFTSNFEFGVLDVHDIEGELVGSDEGWFDVALGVLVDGEKIRIEPLLKGLFERDERWLSNAGLQGIRDTEMVEFRLESGRRLRLGADRLKPIVGLLLDLFQRGDANPLRVSAFDIGRLTAIENTGRWQFNGDAQVCQLAASLRNGAGVTPVSSPALLQGALRHYQVDGISWTNFLSEHSLSGILADEMGLGKTVQGLAHILLEKELGRMQSPVLVVAPGESVIDEWMEKSAQFAPTLKVANLSSIGRQQRYKALLDVDVVLTTYALAWRDIEVLEKMQFHIIILDEAHHIKNASTKASQALRQLKSHHRLALSGTPFQNHLGELWSIFDFILPGFLGTQREFNQRWRTPIEKYGDVARKALLAKRIKPFVLRRLKVDVAPDLPPKTTMVKHIELDGKQRDIYETFRASMQTTVHDAIASLGIERSRIVVLDALTKLRQVCCDPRLIRDRNIDPDAPSAKLDGLIEMLHEQIGDGHRILVFSQFASMLNLIAERLEREDIDYVIQTGETRDRTTPKRRFKKGDVNVFLISLMTGGEGMDLTAADTVILYDPWWNPFREHQASDRPHRLGQTQPVFVYKLVVRGSIEEKMLVLQESKNTLFNDVLSVDMDSSVKFSAQELEALLEPLTA